MLWNGHISRDKCVVKIKQPQLRIMPLPGIKIIIEKQTQTKMAGTRSSYIYMHAYIHGWISCNYIAI